MLKVISKMTSEKKLGKVLLNVFPNAILVRNEGQHKDKKNEVKHFPQELTLFNWK